MGGAATRKEKGYHIGLVSIEWAAVDVGFESVVVCYGLKSSTSKKYKLGHWFVLVAEAVLIKKSA